MITLQLLSGYEENNAWREANSLSFHNGNLKSSQKIIEIKKCIGMNIKFCHAYDWKATHAASASDIIKFFSFILFPQRLNKYILPINNWFLSLWSSSSWMLAWIGQIDALQPLSQLAVILYKMKEYFMFPWMARRASDLEVTWGSWSAIHYLVFTIVKVLSKMYSILRGNKLITNDYKTPTLYLMETWRVF